MSKKSALAGSLTPLKQLTLNFGQRSSPNTARVTRECPDCSMIYRLDDKHEEHLHAKHHTEHTRAPNLLKYVSPKSGEKLVHAYDEGKCVVVEYGTDAPHTVQRACQVLDFVDAQLGIEEKRLSRKLKPLTKFYMFVTGADNRIVGFCMAEPVESAHRIAYLNSENGAFTLGERVASAKCGISRVWVAESARRRRVASRLLDCVSVNFVYVRTLDAPKEIAFSDPTEFGRELARSYCRTNSFLIYNSSSPN